MKLFKRSPDRTAPYYARFQVKGKAYLWSTKTEDLSLAKKRAKHYRDAIVAESFHLVDGMKSRGGLATFADLFADYLTFPAPEDRTRRDNVACFKKVMKASRLGENDTMDRIGADLATNWQKHGRNTGVPATTINSVLRAARSLVSRHALRMYQRDNAPNSEDVRELFSIPLLREPEKRIELPTIEADQKAHNDLPAHPEAYRAFCMARYLGMRASEIKAARRDWIEGVVMYIGGRDFVAKSKRWRAISIPAEVLTILLAAPGDSLVGVFPKQVVNRELPALLHACGFPVKKPLHSLRRLFGSIVYNDLGPAFAKNALGHSTQAVTDKSYARLLTAPAALTFKDHRNTA